MWHPLLQSALAARCKALVQGFPGYKRVLWHQWKQGRALTLPVHNSIFFLDVALYWHGQLLLMVLGRNSERERDCVCVFMCRLRDCQLANFKIRNVVPRNERGSLPSCSVVFNKNKSCIIGYCALSSWSKRLRLCCQSASGTVFVTGLLRGPWSILLQYNYYL